MRKEVYMKTLIELFDIRPIENVLGTEVFRPQETIVLFPPEAGSEKLLKKTMEEYFRYRNCPVKVTVVPVSLLDASKVEKRLREIIASHEDCAIDISGGTDAALFAAGSVSSGCSVGVYTYSRKKHAFFEIKNAPYARNRPCSVTLDVKSCFLMAGGTLLPGRSGHEDPGTRLEQIDRLFRVFREHRRIWRRQIEYIQQISSSEPGKLHAAGPSVLKVDRRQVSADPAFFTDLEREGLICGLENREGQTAFSFPDEAVRFWLRDIGAVLELQVYRSCIGAGCFDDIVLSAVVNWQGGTTQRDAVTNEIDVVAVRGVRPLFISCKTSEIRTEALNELEVLRSRFGGKESRAMIVTSSQATRSRSVMRMRAAELGIEVVEAENLATEKLAQILRQDESRIKRN